MIINSRSQHEQEITQLLQIVRRLCENVRIDTTGDAIITCYYHPMLQSVYEFWVHDFLQDLMEKLLLAVRQKWVRGRTAIPNLFDKIMYFVGQL
jgi:hypothetical protein